LAFADDVDIIRRTQKAMKEAFINLERAAKKMHLQINQDKTKYVPVTKKDCINRLAHIEIGSYKFEVVHSFTYLRSEVNCKNDVSDEIKPCVLSANKCLHGLRKDLKSQLIRRKTRIMMYKVLVRPVLSYASDLAIVKARCKTVKYLQNEDLEIYFWTSGSKWDMEEEV
jgi:hypothetical protein